jgi:hypothetical protein
VRETDSIKDLVLDGLIILEYVKKKMDLDFKWIEVAYVRERWWAAANVVMKHQVP